MSDYSIVYVTKYACPKCNREIVAHLFARPDDKIDDAIRREVDQRTKQEHERGCEGRPAPQKYPRRRGKP